MDLILSLGRKVIPRPLFNVLQPAYHWLMARLAAFAYGWPSRKLIVIGVTGTSGKSTTIELIDAILSGTNHKVGVASTIKFKVGDWEKLNDKKMTMVGRLQLQNLLKQMTKAGCNYAIIETTSEGIKQFRHIGIQYDILVFTNLFPEHIDSHGSFENYRQTKLKLFEHLERLPRKQLTTNNLQLTTVKKTIIANVDDEYAGDFLNYNVDKKLGFSVEDNEANNSGQYQVSSIKYRGSVDEVITATHAKSDANGISFKILNTQYKILIFGSHNVYNALAAISVGASQGIELVTMSKTLERITGIPGRIEFIDEGQDFKIIVDYAFEPKAMQKLYDVVKALKPNKIIQVMGTAGGGRDASHGANNGEMAGQFADIVIATNEDPYDDDPDMLMERVIKGAQKGGKELGKDLYKVSDRREAIAKAVSMVGKDDVVLITGKGTEQGIVVANRQIIPWDDRKVARGELHQLKKISVNPR